MQLVQDTDHEIIPRRGSTVSVRDGSPGDLLTPSAYPLAAVCMTCGQPVRCDKWLMGDWYHTGQDQP